MKCTPVMRLEFPISAPLLPSVGAMFSCGMWHWDEEGPCTLLISDFALKTCTVTSLSIMMGISMLLGLQAVIC
jgi:hypothetical protein